MIENENNAKDSLKENLLSYKLNKKKIWSEKQKYKNRCAKNIRRFSKIKRKPNDYRKVSNNSILGSYYYWKIHIFYVILMTCKKHKQVLLLYK